MDRKTWVKGPKAGFKPASVPTELRYAVALNFSVFYSNAIVLFVSRDLPQPSKETSYSAANIWSKSSPNFTALGPRLQTASSSTSTSQTSKRAKSKSSNSPQIIQVWICLTTWLNVSVWQVSGAVQTRQSLREIHPGRSQERQQRVLQAQEQPPAGGIGAFNGIVQLLFARFV